MTQFHEAPHPVDLESHDRLTRIRAVASAIRRILRGGVNWTGEFTVGNGDSETTIYDQRVRANCHISFMPLDSLAAAVIGSLRVTEINESSDGQGVPVGNFVIVHGDPGADATFRYSINT